MPGKVGVKIKAGRNLPVMDRSSDTTDAYVEIKLGSVTHKTDVCRKSLNPQWNTDWFRFEVDDAELQDEPLQIRLMDYDTYSANDAIGKVNISLNPLCLETSGQATHGKGTVLSGWIPVFDTMHGIRGEVNLIVKVDLFSDLNKFRQSSCGIPFFHSQCIPHGYRAQIIHGFVEELVVNDDPEYQWIDKIRTPRASNEARQVVFLKLSGQVQRKMGLKAINMGANAVIGYTQCFDLEGDVGVVARGIGTAVTLMKDTNSQPPAADNALIEERTLRYLEFLTGSTVGLFGPSPCQLQIRKSRSSTLFELKRRSSELGDSEIMVDLMRQEDERGEKPVKKLRHHMKRFTHSSRNMLNEKYNAFMRKIADNADSKSPQSTSRSLTSLFSSTSGLIKEESGPSTRSSTLDVRRRSSFKAKHKVAAAKPLVPRHSLKKSAHPIVRSVSDDSAMKYSTDGTRKAKVPIVDAIAEYQDSTRSSPNISAEEQQQLSREQEEFDELNTSPNFGTASDDGSGINIVATPHCRRFGEFSKHAPHRRLKGNDVDTALSSSLNTLSMTVSDSSSSDAETENKVDANDVERAKVERFLKICNLDEAEDEKMDEKWIKPSDLDGVDDSLPELRQRHSLLRDLKVFSQHVQDFLHKPKKTTAAAVASHAIGLSLSGIPGLVALQPVQGERKSYYSSQPEISIDCDADMIPPPPSQITHSRSLINLSQSSSACAHPAALPLQLDVKAATKNNLSCINTSISQRPQSESLQLTICQLQTSKCPVLKICPSTPTPTESNNSQLPPGQTKVSSAADDDLPAIVPTRPAVTVSVAANASDSSPLPDECVYVANYSLLSPLVNTTLNTITLSSSQSPSPRNSLPPKFLNANTNTNHSNINSSLLAPTSPTLTSSPSLLSLTPSSSPHASPLLGIKQHTRHYHRTRSLNEIGAPPATALSSTSGVTDSPSMKRFASPASAAVVAAAAVGSSGTTSNPLTAVTSTAPLLGSQRGKLSPSPSKLAINVAAANTSTAPTAVVNSAQSQGDSVSSSATTTTSIATTVIPKETSEMCRRSSDSDLSVTPKGNSLCVASERLVAATAMMRLSQPIAGKNATTDGLDMLEYPFLTMTKYPPGFILHLGATVAARSVKLLERVPNPDEPEVRDSWWTELRMEIRSHARALGCNVVLGYSEATTISDDVCVLSATGTAAVINMAYNRSISQTDILTMTKPTVSSAAAVGIGAMSASLEERELLKDARNGVVNEAVVAAAKETISSSVGASVQSGGGSAGKKPALASFNLAKSSTCTVCHIPYNLSSVPFNVKMKKCAICRKGRVPDVLLATLEVPEYLHVTGRGCFMQAQVVRAKKDLRSELNAKEISDGLPFLEYELHRVLINKLKAKGMNAIFGLRAQVAIGERMIALIATGTALFLTALPVPQVPKIVAGNSWTDKQKLNELQKKLQETFERNQEIYQLKCMDPDVMVVGGGDKQSDTDESDDEVIEIDLNCGNKDTCVLEVDDIEDLEIISLLMEPYPPEGFHVVNTQSVPGMVDMEAVKNLQMFTQVWRAKLDVGQNISGFPKHFQRLLQTIYFKLRTMIPCAICDLRFRLDLPESDQIQLLVTGMALGLGDANKFKYRRKTYAGNGPSEASNNPQVSQPSEMNGTQGNKRALQEEDYIFPLDEDQAAVETPTPTSNLPPYGMHSFKLCKTSPSRLQSKANAASRNRFFPLRDRYGVDITPLSFVPGGRIDKYLGNLNFFFIRETTSIRENGGISGFVHSFITELLAVVRAHIAALGGNAMVSFYMTELILVDNQHKNQGQCLISIGGDAVYVSYYTDD